ncbi:MAG TPA: GTP-binding protein [Holophagaceae bacterium]|nr:GTP-binding protein [Holophagaceae bacterium]
MDALEILIVTGPLGSGKTTAVNALLRRALGEGRKVAVLINEFGAVDVDGTLVAAERPEVAGIASLVNGCVCCSLRDDVVATLAAWAEAPADQRPDRVVLETTGLADPTDLLDLEHDPVLQGRVRIHGILTVLSCLSPLHHLQQRDLLKRQVGLASLLYLSKVDLDPSAAMAWETQLREGHPGLAIVHSRQGVPPEGSPDPWAGDPVRPEGWTDSPEVSFAETRSFSLGFDHPVDPAALEACFLPPLPGPLAQGELLRAKGVCAFAGWAPRADGSDRWAFQVADGRIEISPLPLAPDGGAPVPIAVLIGTGLDQAAWKAALRALERAPEGARRKVVVPGAPRG